VEPGLRGALGLIPRAAGERRVLPESADVGRLREAFPAAPAVVVSCGQNLHVDAKRFEVSLNSREAVLLAARAADDKKASDILIQDVSELMRVTDYFVTVTGANARQVDGIVDGIEETLLDQAGLKPHFVEGRESLEWVLLDYGDFVVHVFQPNVRDFYRLESLWGDAPVIDVAEAGIEDAVYSNRVARLAGRETGEPEDEEE